MAERKTKGTWFVIQRPCTSQLMSIKRTLSMAFSGILPGRGTRDSADRCHAPACADDELKHEQSVAWMRVNID